MGENRLAAECKPLAIWGASGHAKVVLDIVRCQGLYQFIGFLDDLNPGRHGTEFCGAPILGGKDQLPRLLEQKIDILLGFGNCRMRLDLTNHLQSLGFLLPVAIHPHAVIAEDVLIGAGTVVAAGVVLNSGSKIGKSVIINTSASVDHDCIIHDAVHICPGVHIAGHVVVGQATQIGIGASVVDRIHVGSNSMVGAGAVVVKDIPSGVIAYGVPANVKRVID